MSRTSACWRLFMVWLVAAGVLGSVVVGVPLARPAPAWAAPGDACDANNDGVDDGVERDTVSDGDDIDAVNYRDAFGETLAVLADPERWLYTVCVEGDDWNLVSGPVRGLHPDVGDWEELARGAALEEIRDEFYRPDPWMMPHDSGRQTVNHETWLAVDPAVYEPASARIVRSAEVGGVSVEVVAAAVGADFAFSDGVTVFCPVDTNVVYDVGLLPDVPCGREWDEPFARGEVSVEPKVRYEVTWVSSLGNVSPFASLELSSPLARFDLEVTEIQAFLSEDGTRVPAVPEFGRRGSLREGDDGCSGFTAVFKPDCVADFIIEQILERLPEPVKAVLETILDFLEGCGEFAAESIGDIASSITQVVSALSDPEAFLDEKWSQAMQIYEAITTNGQQFFEDLATSAIKDELRLDLVQGGEYGRWAGFMGCKAVVAIVTGGAAQAKLIKTVTDVIDSRFPDINRRDRDRENDDDPDDDSSAPPCRSNSFPSGTPVLMADGSRISIELIKPGDRVTTYDTNLGIWSGNIVLDQWSGIYRDSMVDVTLSDGSAVTSTAGHLFWVAAASGEWVPAGQLTKGDLLLTPKGVMAVAGVTSQESQPAVVWELDTAYDNTFLVGAGTNDVLVHNCEFDERAEDLSTAARNHPDVGNGRTAGGGSGSVNGEDFEYLSASHESHTPNGFVEPPDDPVFSPTEFGNTDAEYKIMEQAAADIDELLFPGQPRPPPGTVIPEAEGIIRIVVDSPPGRVCDSCAAVIEEFRRRYPNVPIEVRDVVGGTP